MPARVLLVYPPSRGQPHDSCPSSLTILGAVLRRAGHEVHLLDANAAARRRDSDQIVRFADELKPDVIGLTLVTPLVGEAYRLASALRATGAKLLAGGPHATLLPEEPLAHGFDATVIGEGEPTIDEAVRALVGEASMDGVAGWVYRDDTGRPRRTAARPPVADLDALPPPARDLVDPADYGRADGRRLHGNLFSSRGCPGKCTYCSGGLFGKRFRFRSAASLLDELGELRARYQIPHFHFMDDAMSANRERLLELCAGLESRAFGVTWSMMTRIDFVDEEILTAARRAGCIEVDYGVESGHPETLRRIRKAHTVPMVRRIIPLTAALGIKPTVFFILGFPWDTPASLDETLGLMQELSPHVTCFHPAVASILIPFPGTEIYERYQAQHGFGEWWLQADRNYDAVGRQRAYFETQLFANGAVLDADFFHYSPAVRRKIYEVFVFMWHHNLSRSPRTQRITERVLFDSSRGLHALSPALERQAFGVAARLRQTVARFRRQAA